MNMIHITKGRSKHALRDICAVEPVAPKFNPWSACPITFDRRDHRTSIRHGGFAALVLDPIVDGFHLTRVLMDGGSSLNLLYQDTVRKMGIDPSCLGSIVGFARLPCFGTLRSIVSTKVALGEPLRLRPS